MKDKLALSTLTLGHTLVHWYFQGFLLIVPFVIKEFSLSFSQAGLLVSYRTILGAIVNIPAGALVDWLGKRRLILAVSILWSAIIYLMVGLSPNYVILQIMVALVGIGGSTWHPAAMSTLSNRLPSAPGFCPVPARVWRQHGRCPGPLSHRYNAGNHKLEKRSRNKRHPWHRTGSCPLVPHGQISGVAAHHNGFQQIYSWIKRLVDQ